MRTNLQKVQLALTIILHLAGWGLFIYLTMPHFNRMARMPAEDFFWFPALSYLFLAIYFYANSSVFVPRYLSKRKVALYLLITAAAYLFFCVALSWVLRELFLSDNAAFSDFQPGQGMPPDRSNFPPFEGDSMAMPPRRGMGMPPGQSGFPPPFRDSTAMMPPRRFDSPPFDPATNQWSYLVARLGLYARSSQFLVVFIVSTGLKVVSQWYAEQRRLQELENSMVQAELSFLKSQIHPHFLFNCLNSIYYLALSKDDKAPEAILSLSDFLRFVTTESSHSRIPLAKEVKMLEEYFHLQSLRASEKFELKFLLDGDFRDRTIMPLTFVPFVENAFKYGISAHTHCFIHTSITLANGRLTFTCDNSISALKDRSSSTGVGLENIRKRLELAYPDRHSLAIHSDSRAFYVKLHIDLE